MKWIIFLFVGLCIVSPIFADLGYNSAYTQGSGNTKENEVTEAFQKYYNGYSTLQTRTGISLRVYEGFDLSNLSGITLSNTSFSWYHQTDTNEGAYTVNLYYCNATNSISGLNLTWNNQDTEVINCEASPFTTFVMNGISDNTRYTYSLGTRVGTTGRKFVIKIKFDNEASGSTSRYSYFSSWNASTVANRPQIWWTGTTVTSTCTYSGSGNWAISCSDNCNLTTAADMAGNNVTISGAGTIHGLNNINNARHMTIIGGCRASWKN